MDTWVQCYKCQKWRNVGEAKVPDAPWECRYNVFHPQYNTCAAPQEPMEEEEEDEVPMFDMEGIDLVPDKDTEMFTPSACKCAMCRETNIAVTEWDKKADHHIPIIRAIINSIDKSEGAAEASEDDKQWVSGRRVDLKNPVAEVMKMSQDL